MDSKRLNVFVSTERELNEIKELWKRNRFNRLFVLPELVAQAGVCRSFIGANYKIIAVVDHPDGERRGASKFCGSTTEFFLTDGYDVVLPKSNPSDVGKDLKKIYDFVRNMIDQSVEIGYTINYNKNWPEIRCLKYLNPIPLSFIKTEAIPKGQKLKPESFSDLIRAIKEHTPAHIIISSNISYDLYKAYPEVGLLGTPKHIGSLIDEYKHERSELSGL